MLTEAIDLLSTSQGRIPHEISELLGIVLGCLGIPKRTSWKMVKQLSRTCSIDSSTFLGADMQHTSHIGSHSCLPSAPIAALAAVPSLTFRSHQFRCLFHLASFASLPCSHFAFSGIKYEAMLQGDSLLNPSGPVEVMWPNLGKIEFSKDAWKDVLEEERGEHHAAEDYLFVDEVACINCQICTEAAPNTFKIIDYPGGT